MNSKIEKQLKDILVQYIEPEYHEKIYELNEDDDLSNSGFNSITFVKIAIKIEDAFGMVFDDDDLSYLRFPTLRTLSKYINSKNKVREGL